MSYKRFIPCIFIKNGKAVTWFDDMEVLSDNVYKLAKNYCENGADELIVFDLSDTDDEHEEAVDIIKKINHNLHIPISVGGNVKRLEDVKKYLYAGAKKAILNGAKSHSEDLIAEASLRFGADKIAASLNDFDTLFKQQNLIQTYVSELVFLHRLDLDSVVNVTDLPAIVITDTMNEEELLHVLQKTSVKGLSGRFISQKDMNFHAYKETCAKRGISIDSFDRLMEFSEFSLNADGLLPVIVQHYKTQEVLMMAYMNEEAFYHTLKSGLMTYYSRSRKSLWVKGETSGHYQYVKSLTIDCDKDTLLAKVDQVGPACHTGNPTCFFQPVTPNLVEEQNPLMVFENVYDTILDRKKNPKEGSYTNYLFDKGIDKILKKVGEEATEIIIAAKNPNPEEIKYEISDFLYHVMVLMAERGVTWEDIIEELANR